MDTKHTMSPYEMISFYDTKEKIIKEISLTSVLDLAIDAMQGNNYSGPCKAVDAVSAMRDWLHECYIGPPD